MYWDCGIKSVNQKNNSLLWENKVIIGGCFLWEKERLIEEKKNIIAALLQEYDIQSA